MGSLRWRPDGWSSDLWSLCRTQTAHATRACKTTPPVERERAVLIGSHCPELETPGAILCATAAHTTNEGRVMKDEYKQGGRASNKTTRSDQILPKTMIDRKAIISPEFF